MPRPPKPKQKPPHAFVVDALMPLSPEVRRMFSGFAVYLGDHMVCMLRDSPKSPRDNGVWLVLSDSTNPKDRELLPDTINPPTRYTLMPPVDAKLCPHRVQRNPASG
jgi:hypothetical protein